VLGVKRDAGEKEIRSSYRKLARQYHPDVNPGDKKAEERFKEINAAYEVLKDVDKRKKYDKYGDKWEYADQIEEQQRRAGAHDYFRRGSGTRTSTGTAGSAGGADFDLGDIGGGFEDILGGLFRGRGTPKRTKGEDLEYPVDVSLEEAYAGTARMIQLQVPEACSACNGTGKVAGNMCVVCEGLGSTIKSSRIEVKIPAGVDTGSRVRIAGKGHPGLHGGPNGDMILLVTVRPNEKFERKGDDLYTEVPAPVADLVLGGEVGVPTPKGTTLKLTVPAGTQNGRQFRLRGQGMPHLGSNAKGDLYAKVRAVLPTSPSSRERELFEELRRLQTGATAGAA
jgi:molecular chaperone DnaJ